MRWEDLKGHAQQREWFQTALERGRLASSFLFVGQSGIGKRTFAKLLAKSLLCRGTEANLLEHCGTCEDCVQVEASTHPDLIQLAKPAEKAYLPIELLIGEREKRMREGLCHDIALKPYAGRRKVAILDDADTLNNEGANCLLKTLEEPPNRSMLILISSGLQRQLPTIRSRCQTILFRPLREEQVAEILPAAWKKISSDPECELSAEQIQHLAAQSGGSVEGLWLAEDESLRDFHSELLSSLASPKLAVADLIKSFSGIVDAAGKDNRLKRDRMRVLFLQAADFYRSLVLRLNHSDATQVKVGPQVEQAVSNALAHWRTGVEGAIRCWNRCLQAVEQVDRNANQAALLEAWTADLMSFGGT